MDASCLLSLYRRASCVLSIHDHSGTAGPRPWNTVAWPFGVGAAWQESSADKSAARAAGTCTARTVSVSSAPARSVRGRRSSTVRWVAAQQLAGSWHRERWARGAQALSWWDTVVLLSFGADVAAKLAPLGLSSCTMSGGQHAAVGMLGRPLKCREQCSPLHGFCAPVGLFTKRAGWAR